MDQDAPTSSDAPAGAPAWVMTFADLMSLLMCFFVLLLSFSEMDAQKYKQLSGSMKQAFGVQREVKAHEIPKGINVIATEFSAGRPDPTPLNEVRQKTTKDKSENLDWGKGAGKGGQGEQSQSEKALEMLLESDLKVESELDMAEIKEIKPPSQSYAEFLQAELKNEIKKGNVEVDIEKGNRIVIRIKEKGSFFSGSASLRQSFGPAMDKIRKTLVEIPGEISVAGHTDNRSISTRQFRSNWDLSSARAVSVAHALMHSQNGDKTISPRRIVITGHADTKPLAKNDTAENRALNRRVEIIIIQKTDSVPKLDDNSSETAQNETEAPEDAALSQSTQPEAVNP